VDDRRPLALGGIQSLPVPGRLSLGSGEPEREIELYPADGHTADGTAYLMPWLQTLVCGDYLSPVEIPWISADGSVDAYEATLDRLRPIVERVDMVIPGHGRPVQRAEALSLLEEDLVYVRALRDAGADAPLPAGRRTETQRRIHARNAEHTAR
jgi:glyoxylase-like metal-dependent hydrolase (beta-lactamase superfamily II)